MKNLKNEIENNKCNWISISGGGDPLYNYKDNKDWYLSMLKSIPVNVKKELHTSYVNIIDAPYGNFDRVVYHLRYIEQVPTISKHGNQIVRIVFVVTETFNNEYIDDIVKKVKDNSNIDELSFRQMVNSNYETTNYCEKYLDKGHKKNWWYIKQGDYNLYYVENKIFHKYCDFK